MDVEKEELVVIPLKRLAEVIQSIADSTMEKWLDRKIQQEREDKKNEETMLTPKEVAKTFKIGLSTVYAKIKSKELPHRKIGAKILVVKRDAMKALNDGKL